MSDPLGSYNKLSDTNELNEELMISVDFFYKSVDQLHRTLSAMEAISFISSNKVLGCTWICVLYCMKPLDSLRKNLEDLESSFRGANRAGSELLLQLQAHSGRKADIGGEDLRALKLADLIARRLVLILKRFARGSNANLELSFLTNEITSSDSFSKGVASLAIFDIINNPNVKPEIYDLLAPKIIHSLQYHIHHFDEIMTSFCSHKTYYNDEISNKKNLDEKFTTLLRVVSGCDNDEDLLPVQYYIRDNEELKILFERKLSYEKSNAILGQKLNELSEQLKISFASLRALFSLTSCLLNSIPSRTMESHPSILSSMETSFPWKIIQTVANLEDRLSTPSFCSTLPQAFRQSGQRAAVPSLTPSLSDGFIRTNSCRLFCAAACRHSSRLQTLVLPLLLDSLVSLIRTLTSSHPRRSQDTLSAVSRAAVEEGSEQEGSLALSDVTFPMMTNGATERMSVTAIAASCSLLYWGLSNNPLGMQWLASLTVPVQREGTPTGDAVGGVEPLWMLFLQSCIDERLGYQSVCWDILKSTRCPIPPSAADDEFQDLFRIPFTNTQQAQRELPALPISGVDPRLEAVSREIPTTTDATWFPHSPVFDNEDACLAQVKKLCTSPDICASFLHYHVDKLLSKSNNTNSPVYFPKDRRLEQALIASRCTGSFHHYDFRNDPSFSSCVYPIHVLALLLQSDPMSTLIVSLKAHSLRSPELMSKFLKTMRRDLIFLQIEMDFERNQSTNVQNKSPDDDTRIKNSNGNLQGGTPLDGPSQSSSSAADPRYFSAACVWLAETAALLRCLLEGNIPPRSHAHGENLAAQLLLRHRVWSAVYDQSSPFFELFRKELTPILSQLCEIAVDSSSGFPLSCTSQWLGPKRQSLVAESYRLLAAVSVIDSSFIRKELGRVHRKAHGNSDAQYEGDFGRTDSGRVTSKTRNRKKSKSDDSYKWYKLEWFWPLQKFLQKCMVVLSEEISAPSLKSPELNAVGLQSGIADRSDGLRNRDELSDTADASTSAPVAMAATEEDLQRLAIEELEMHRIEDALYAAMELLEVICCEEEYAIALLDHEIRPFNEDYNGRSVMEVDLCEIFGRCLSGKAPQFDYKMTICRLSSLLFRVEKVKDKQLSLVVEQMSTDSSSLLESNVVVPSQFRSRFCSENVRVGYICRAFLDTCSLLMDNQQRIIKLLQRLEDTRISGDDSTGEKSAHARPIVPSEFIRQMSSSLRSRLEVLVEEVPSTGPCIPGFVPLNNIFLDVPMFQTASETDLRGKPDESLSSSQEAVDVQKGDSLSNQSEGFVKQDYVWALIQFSNVEKYCVNLCLVLLKTLSIICEGRSEFQNYIFINYPSVFESLPKLLFGKAAGHYRNHQPSIISPDYHKFENVTFTSLLHDSKNEFKLKHRPNLLLASAVTQALRMLTGRHSQAKALVISSGGIEAAIALLRYIEGVNLDQETSESIGLEISQTLEHITARNVLAWEKLAVAAGVSGLLALSRIRRPIIQVQALTTLIASLAFHESTLSTITVRTRPTDRNPPISVHPQDVISGGGDRVLLELITSDNLEVQYSALRLLHSVLRMNPNMRNGFFNDVIAVDVLCSLLRNADPSVVRSVCEILMLLGSANHRSLRQLLKSRMASSVSSQDPANETIRALLVSVSTGLDIVSSRDAITSPVATTSVRKDRATASRQAANVLAAGTLSQIDKETPNLRLALMSSGILPALKHKSDY